MTEETEHLIIKYNKDDKTYIKKIEETLEKETNRLVNFYGIKKLKTKIIVNIINSKKEFDKKYYEAFGIVSTKWTIGFSNSEVYVLSYNDYKNTYHKKESINYSIDNIVKELSYICQNIVSKNKCSLKYINEGLAYYLSNQFDETDTLRKLEISVDDLLNEKNIDYYIYYMIVKYILENYKRDYIINIISDRDFAYSETEKIYNDCINYYNKEEKI